MNRFERTHEELKRQLDKLKIRDEEIAAEECKIPELESSFDDNAMTQQEQRKFDMNKQPAF